MTPSKNDSLDPEVREKLLAELKKRLKEIEKLKNELAEKMGAKKDGNLPPYESAFDPGIVREAVEEISVPALELLDDTPIQKKPKKEVASPSA